MFNITTRAASCAGVAFLISAVTASAQMLPTSTNTGTPLENARMLDARVNMKDAYIHAMSARPGAAQTGLHHVQSTESAIAGAVVNLQRAMPAAEVRLSNLTGAPRVVSSRNGSLTAPAPGKSSESIARDFLTDHSDVFGLSDSDIGDLVVLGDSPGGTSGLRMLRMEQQIDGRPVFQSETRFLLKRDGSLTSVLGQMVPSARALTAQIDWNSSLSAADAVTHLLTAAGKIANASDFTVSNTDDGRIELSQTNDFLKGNVTTRQIFFPLSPGVLVPAWSIVAFTNGDQDWYAVVDAQTGDVLWRKGIRAYSSAHDALFRVYVQPDGVTPSPSPAPNSTHTIVNPGSGTQFTEIAPTVVSMHTAYDPVASPNGWIDDCPAGGCTANQTQTLGNNALICMDQVQTGTDADVCDTAAATVIDGNGRPTGNPDANGRNRNFTGTAPRDFQTNFLPPPQAGNPEAGQTATGNGTSGTAAIDQFRRGMMTHLFYVTNWYHDRLYELGFDEASGNFQQTNFSGQGLGGDRVLGDADDGSGTNNANFATPPDGTSGRMQMYRFTGPTIDRDGALDAEISMHEMTHGTSNRLVGNGAGLNWDPAAGMGEGWSDFVALSLLYNKQSDDPTARYAAGAYGTYKLAAGYLDNYVYGIRRFPYEVDRAVNSLTWADVDDVTNNLSGGIAPDPLGFNINGGAELHNIGEVWANTLWEVRSRIIADPAGANGSVPVGNHTSLQLIIDALKMTPIDPSFTDARDAVLNADCSTNACANEDSIWSGFAYRGLGYGASSPYNILYSFSAGHIGVHESFDTPFLDVADPSTDVVVDDSVGNGNGAIDPGEAVKLSVTLTNPWRAASKAVSSASATLTTTTPGVTIYKNTATYGAIAPQGSASGDNFVVGLSSTVACGSSIDFVITTTSNIGTTSATFSLRAGPASGTDPVVTYTGTPSPALAVANSRPRGVFNQINVTDDFAIANVDFRINSITTSRAIDITAMLHSPDNVGIDLISLIDALEDSTGGVNITNMVTDDNVAFTAANDMVQATTAAAPYSKTWLPVFNAPWPLLTTFPTGPDPVGNLSRFNGKSTKGTWTALVSDQGLVTGGATFNGWSMLVTPVHFACSATPGFGANISATKTVSGNRDVGATVTYTVTLTNNGAGVQLDNPGHEFTDVLPSSLTLVSATATSGTAVNSGNTATWDGSLAPLGGSVTITITATINANPGQTISNQGTVSYDSNGDGTNDATVLTDDPSVGGAADPTTFTMNSAHVSGTKTVTGNFYPYGVVTYTIVLTNNGNAPANDNAGNEFTDVLPADLTLRSATASSGTASSSVSGSVSTVNWNGALAPGDSVTITIQGQIKPGTEGDVVVNQGTINYNAFESSSNDTSGLTDDPSVGGATDPTSFTVIDEIFKDGFDG